MIKVPVYEKYSVLALLNLLFLIWLSYCCLFKFCSLSFLFYSLCVRACGRAFVCACVCVWQTHANGGQTITSVSQRVLSLHHESPRMNSCYQIYKTKHLYMFAHLTGPDLLCLFVCLLWVGLGFSFLCFVWEGVLLYRLNWPSTHCITHNSFLYFPNAWTIGMRQHAPHFTQLFLPLFLFIQVTLWLLLLTTLQ